MPVSKDTLTSTPATVRAPTVIVPHIEGLESYTRMFARERDWDEVHCEPWQSLSPSDPNSVSTMLAPYGAFQHHLPNTSAYFGHEGRLTGILVTLPDGATVREVMETYEDAMKYYKIAYRLVSIPPEGTPGLLFLAPGETGEAVNEIKDPSLPF